MTNKTIDTLVKDIYSYLGGYPEVSKEAIDELAFNLSQVITDKLQHYRKPALSMSCIGHPVRKLNLSLQQPSSLSGKDRLKFLYGDIIETLVLWLAKQAGHSVTEQQKEVELDGVKGHIDAVIDGSLIDLKSCSPYSYKKFSEGTLPHNDPFGYLAQISSYKTCTGLSRAGFLAVDKVSGDMCVYEPDPDFYLPNPHVIIANARTAIAKPFKDLPLCEEPVPHGKSGNMKLSTGCRLCSFRDKCYPNLTPIKYSTGTEYFTVIKKQPRVKAVKSTKKTHKAVKKKGRKRNERKRLK